MVAETAKYLLISVEGVYKSHIFNDVSKQECSNIYILHSGLWYFMPFSGSSNQTEEKSHEESEYGID